MYFNWLKDVFNIKMFSILFGIIIEIILIY